MNNRFANLFFVAAICLIFINCANRGTPQGGPKDIEPPKILKSEPENFSTNFSEEEIRIYFNEFVKIKDLQKQLIISPPMDPQPEITPLGGASKYINIKITDTLEANTTYAFNFGNSIVDNNEENPYPFYRYVFSTGDYIDSLTVKGQVFDALKKKADDFVSVVLYEVDSTFTDSIIYKKPPKYVTNTLDSLTTFNLENVKEGQYLLIALKDENQDYKFQQKIDKIGFHKGFINLPTDSIYNLKLFKEDIDFNATRPSLISGEKIAFGYEGDYEGMKINILSETPEDFFYTIIKDESADTLYYWYKPKLEVDSLVFNVSKDDFSKDFTLKIRSREQDTLKINAKTTGNINYSEPFKISASTPLKTVDEAKISIIDKDSLKIDFETSFDSLTNIVALDFEKTESNSYKIQILPDGLIDFYEKSNDTLNYSIKTKAFSDYGNIRVSLQNAKYPIIVQLTDEKGEVKAEEFSEEPKFFDFRYINPGKYLLRIIFDGNGNKKYDTGDYLKKQQPERVSHYPELIDVRANWDEIREFILLD